MLLAHQIYDFTNITALGNNEIDLGAKSKLI